MCKLGKKFRVSKYYDNFAVQTQYLLSSLFAQKLRRMIINLLFITVCIIIFALKSSNGKYGLAKTSLATILTMILTKQI